MYDTLVIVGAKYLVFLPVVVVVLYIIFAPWWKSKKMLILGAVGLPLSYLVAKVAGYFYFDPRPFVVGPPAGGFTPLVAHAADNGFPSEHTLFAAALACVVFTYNRALGVTLWVVAALVALSRVLAGVHHSVDVLGSAIIAIVVVSAVYLLLKWLPWYD